MCFFANIQTMGPRPQRTSGEALLALSNTGIIREAGSLQKYLGSRRNTPVRVGVPGHLLYSVVASLPHLAPTLVWLLGRLLGHGSSGRNWATAHWSPAGPCSRSVTTLYISEQRWPVSRGESTRSFDWQMILAMLSLPQPAFPLG